VHLFFEMTDGSSVAFFDLGDNTASEPSPNTPRWVNHLALRVDSVEAVHTALDRLRGAGLDVIGPVDHDGFVVSIYFFDPNGIRLELTTVTASDSQLQTYRAESRMKLDAWTLEKSARAAKVA
jgi:catechol 2,3-dioxygenase-like lactoylglutathione lyase family enzyme